MISHKMILRSKYKVRNEKNITLKDDMPNFPIFKKIDMRDKNEIYSYTRQFLPYSDFNFASLWSNDTHHDTSYSWLNNNLIVRFRDYTTKHPFFSFLGVNKVTETIAELITFSSKQGLSREIHLVPESCIKDLLPVQTSMLIIQEDRDQYDYIIPLKETIELSNINEHKRKAFQDFLLHYPGYEIRKLELSNMSSKGDIKKLFNIWSAQKRKTNDEISHEWFILERLLEHGSFFDFLIMGLYVGEELIGFTIDEYLKKPFVMGHYIKANFSYRGVYEVLNKCSAELHYAGGYKYINIEQDLGINGLRISKLQRSPAFYLKKYSILGKDVGA